MLMIMNIYILLARHTRKADKSYPACAAMFNKDFGIIWS